MTHRLKSVPLHFLAGALVGLLSTFIAQYGLGMTLNSALENGSYHMFVFAFVIGAPLGLWIAYNYGKGDDLRRVSIQFMLITPIAYAAAIYATIVSAIF